MTVKPTGCEFDPHSRRWNIYLNLYFLRSGVEAKAALSSATQHAMPPEFSRKWGISISINLPTLLCAGYSVKLILIKNIIASLHSGRVWLWQNASLSPATQHAMLPEFGRSAMSAATQCIEKFDGKWRTEYLNTKFPLPTPLCTGYKVKLIYLI